MKSVRYSTEVVIAACIIIIIIIVFISLYWLFYNAPNKPLVPNDIALATDNWINAVTERHDSEEIAQLFCSDGNLLGTVSQIKRKKEDIKFYFDYFANIPGIRVLKRKYHIYQLATNIFLNIAFMEWNWDQLKKPIIARMTFIYRGKCIYHLHSSGLPEFNYQLYQISNNS